jgi:hypothetical protein
MRPTLLLLPLAALLLPAQAPAPDKPAVQPIRDVTVEYKMMDSDGPDAPPRARQITVYWANGGMLMRIQMADDRYYVVINRNTNRMMMVLLDQHGYVEGPFDPKRQTGFTVPADLPLLRGESDIVAGNPCTLWNAKIGHGRWRGAERPGQPSGPCRRPDRHLGDLRPAARHRLRPSPRLPQAGHLVTVGRNPRRHAGQAATIRLGSL